MTSISRRRLRHIELLVVDGALALRGRLAAASGRAHRARRHDAKVRQVPIDVGVDGGDLAERRLVQLLQDLEARSIFRLQRAERLGERADDRRRPERVRVRFELRLAEQMADAAVERDELFVADVLDDAHDVADEHGLVDGVEVDQCELRRVDLREIGFSSARPEARSSMCVRSRFSNSAITAARSVISACRASRNSCCSARTSDLPGALHQHVAHAVEQRGERKQEPVDRQVAAIGEDFRQLAGDAAAGRRDAGRYVLGWHRRCRSVIYVSKDAYAASGFNGLACFLVELTLARGPIVCHFPGASAVPRQSPPKLFRYA